MGCLLLAGCTTTTYGYQYRMQQQFTGGEEPEPPGREARDMLANARTVAFYPPDECVNADPTAAHERQAEIHARCGAMMSQLERAAEDAGYQVLSWQNLRGNRRAIEYAREANVDVLFEINEMSPSVLDDMSVQHTFDFFEGDGTGSDTPLQVSTQVAEGCRDYAFRADPPKAAALTGSVDIKAVSVSDGRDRWHYRKTEEQSLGREYPRVRFTAANQPPKYMGVMLGLGIGALVGGGTGVLMDAITTDDPTTPTVNEHIDTSSWAPPLLIAGGVLVLASIVVGVSASEKPDPAKTLCNDKLAAVVPGAAPTPSVMSSEHTFEQSHTGDAAAEAKKQVIARMTKQFIDEIKAAKTSRPTTVAPPVTAPPAPTPAAPAPTTPAPTTPAPAAPTHP
ncbi:MAG: hypothetical protein JO257_14480 [Deltaproteobacteria bacterium]|nr:hypothetical protein [Deltaproteobacteria bacterium]